MTIVSAKSGIAQLRMGKRWSSTSPLGKDKLTSILKDAEASVTRQSLALRDLCVAARLPKQDLEAFSRESLCQNDEKTSLKAVLSSFKAYCIRISALQGEAESLSKEILELIERNNQQDKETSASVNASDQASTIPEISENEVELEETAPTPQQVPQEISVQDITEYLHGKSIDFSDCYDEESLKKRYLEVKSGTYRPLAKVKTSMTRSEEKTVTKSHGICPIREPPSHDNSYSSQSSGRNNQENMNYGGSSKGAIMGDPYPGAERRMCDPMKFVWEVKQDICRGRGVNSSQVDIWVGPLRLDDTKRMYEYPQCQRTPMEVRMKGDTRINKNLV